jgi:uncharacterized Zn finger protein (UPF0148 family)
MRIRGKRECQECGTRWTYYETGSVNCPDCGSLHSVGVGERTQHTDSAAELDLTPAHAMVDTEPIDLVAEKAADLAGAYVRRRGFVHAGELRILDDQYLAAAELATVGNRLRRSLRPEEDAEYYLLELLGLADAGERPPPEDVPATLRGARGLAYADAVGTYRRELVEWDRTDPATVRRELEGLETHVRRIQTLDGDVDPTVVEALIEAARDVGTVCRSGTADADAALARARDRLDRLERRDRLD